MHFQKNTIPENKRILFIVCLYMSVSTRQIFARDINIKKRKIFLKKEEIPQRN